MLRVLDLFSGIGGFSLALKRTGGFKTVAYCEIEPYCQAVLLDKMREGALDIAPICADVKLLDPGPWQGNVEIITAGFPCPDISFAGKNSGIDGERTGLWRPAFALIRDIRPRYVILENVAALLDRGLGVILGELARMGYDAEWRVLPACRFGAAHCRERVWIVADADRQGRTRLGSLPDSRTAGPWRWDREKDLCAVAAGPFDRRNRWWPQPLIRRDDGLSNRVDRHHALGNSIVPQIAEWIGRRIIDVSGSSGRAPTTPTA